MQESPIPANAARRLAHLAVEIARAVDGAVATGRPADVALAELFREHKEYGARDRRFLSNAVFSFFRWKGWTRTLPIEEAVPVSYLLDAEEPHPAATLLATECGRDGQPLGGSSLRGKAQAFARWTGGSEPDAASLVPAWTQDAVPADRLDRCIASFQQRPPTWLRARTGRENDVIEALGRAGIPARQHARLPSALAVDGASPLRALPPAVQPLFEIQDLASQCVGLVCSPAPGESWWDTCAGAGGKSLHLADLMKDTGSIVATDIRPAALRELRRRAGRAGAGILQAASAFPSSALFDGVLVDAPCSGVGTWSRNPDARWRTGGTDVAEKAAVQARLLHDAADHVRPGGRLVYAVCTLTEAETSGVVGPFLESRAEFAPEKTTHPLDGKTEDGIIRVWPWDGPCDGMFVCAMRRKGGG